MDKNKSITLFFVGLLYVAAMVYVNRLVLSGAGFFGTLKIVGILSPLLLMVALSLRQYWAGFIVGLLPIDMALPIPLFDRIRPAVFALLLIVPIILADRIIRKEKIAVFNNDWSRMILFAGAIVFLKTIIERPGSARMGGAGGFSIVIFFLAGFAGYWALSRHCAKELNSKVTIKALLVAAILGLVLYTKNYFVQAGIRGAVFFSPFERHSWLLAPLVLAYAFEREEQGKSSARFILFSALGVMLLAGVTSAFRSRFLFSIGAALAVAWIYNKHKRTFVQIAGGGIVGLVLLLAVTGGQLPKQVLRPLSLFLPHLAYEQREGGAEVGWSSSFRARVMGDALKKISEKPLWGHGFKFTAADLIAEIQRQEVGDREGMYGQLDLTRSYHNTFLMVGAAYGAPAALFLLIGYFRVWAVFLLGLVRKMRGQDRILFAGLMGYLVSSTGQALMNGGAIDAAVLLAICGVLNGTIYRYRHIQDIESQSTVVLV